MSGPKYDFPAIRVSEKDIYFNALCKELKEARSIIVSKAGDKLIFRASESLDGFRKRVIRDSKYFFISSSAIRRISQIKAGYYRLYKMQCGAWYVNMNEPLNKM